MNIVEIQEPIWKDRSVGISEDKIGVEGCIVKIMYKDKSGVRVYPNKYLCTYEQAIKSPRMLRRGNALRLVRIKDLELA